jgi:hypothetical protein
VVEEVKKGGEGGHDGRWADSTAVRSPPTICGGGGRWWRGVRVVAGRRKTTPGKLWSVSPEKYVERRGREEE